MPKKKMGSLQRAATNRIEKGMGAAGSGGTLKTSATNSTSGIKRAARGGNPKALNDYRFGNAYNGSQQLIGKMKSEDSKMTPAPKKRGNTRNM